MAHATSPSCEPSLFPQTLEGITVAEVKTGRLPVFLDSEACSRTEGLCPSKSYLVRGDQVIAAQTLDSYRCVAFVGRHRQTTGWVRDDALMPAHVPASLEWSGTWVRKLGDATLEITPHHGKYTVVAEATAQGAEPENVRTGGAHGALIIEGDQAKVIDTQGGETCQLQLQKIGFLVVANDGASDDANSPCGGMGVSMNGLYVRQTR